MWSANDACHRVLLGAGPPKVQSMQGPERSYKEDFSGLRGQGPRAGLCQELQADHGHQALDHLTKLSQ